VSKLVLLIDDEEDVRETLRDILEDRGYRVSVAENGRAALDLLRSNERPCFVLLDLIMPEMNGWEFLDAIERDEELADLPIVISTSAPDQAPADRRVLPKPLNLAMLLEQVRVACPNCK
jgi:CheY-like chemotaxis protein